MAPVSGSVKKEQTEGEEEVSDCETNLCGGGGGGRRRAVMDLGRGVATRNPIRAGA